MEEILIKASESARNLPLLGLGGHLLSVGVVVVFAVIVKRTRHLLQARSELVARSLVRPTLGPNQSQRRPLDVSNVAGFELESECWLGQIFRRTAGAKLVPNYRPA